MSDVSPWSCCCCCCVLQADENDQLQLVNAQLQEQLLHMKQQLIMTHAAGTTGDDGQSPCPLPMQPLDHSAISSPPPGASSDGQPADHPQSSDGSADASPHGCQSAMSAPQSSCGLSLASRSPPRVAYSAWAPDSPAGQGASKAVQPCQSDSTADVSHADAPTPSEQTSSVSQLSLASKTPPRVPFCAWAEEVLGMAQSEAPASVVQLLGSPGDSELSLAIQQPASLAVPQQQAQAELAAAISAEHSTAGSGSSVTLQPSPENISQLSLMSRSPPRLPFEAWAEAVSTGVDQQQVQTVATFEPEAGGGYDSPSNHDDAGVALLVAAEELQCSPSLLLDASPAIPASSEASAGAASELSLASRSPTPVPFASWAMAAQDAVPSAMPGIGRYVSQTAAIMDAGAGSEISQLSSLGSLSTCTAAAKEEVEAQLSDSAQPSPSNLPATPSGIAAGCSFSIRGGQRTSDQDASQGDDGEAWSQLLAAPSPAAASVGSASVASFVPCSPMPSHLYPWVTEGAQAEPDPQPDVSALASEAYASFMPAGPASPSVAVGAVDAAATDVTGPMHVTMTTAGCVDDASTAAAEAAPASDPCVLHFSPDGAYSGAGQVPVSASLNQSSYAMAGSAATLEATSVPINNTCIRAPVAPPPAAPLAVHDASGLQVGEELAAWHEALTAAVSTPDGAVASPMALDTPLPTALKVGLPAWLAQTSVHAVQQQQQQQHGGEHGFNAAAAAPATAAHSYAPAVGVSQGHLAAARAGPPAAVSVTPLLSPMDVDTEPLTVIKPAAASRTLAPQAVMVPQPAARLPAAHAPAQRAAPQPAPNRLARPTAAGLHQRPGSTAVGLARANPTAAAHHKLSAGALDAAVQPTASTHQASRPLPAAQTARLPATKPSAGPTALPAASPMDWSPLPVQLHAWQGQGAPVVAGPANAPVPVAAAAPPVVAAAPLAAAVPPAAIAAAVALGGSSVAAVPVLQAGGRRAPVALPTTAVLHQEGAGRTLGAHPLPLQQGPGAQGPAAAQRLMHRGASRLPAAPAMPAHLAFAATSTARMPSALVPVALQQHAAVQAPAGPVQALALPQTIAAGALALPGMPACSPSGSPSSASSADTIAPAAVPGRTWQSLGAAVQQPSQALVTSVGPGLTSSAEVATNRQLVFNSPVLSGLLGYQEGAGSEGEASETEEGGASCVGSVDEGQACEEYERQGYMLAQDEGPEGAEPGDMQPGVCERAFPPQAADADQQSEAEEAADRSALAVHMQPQGIPGSCEPSSPLDPELPTMTVEAEFLEGTDGHCAGLLMVGADEFAASGQVSAAQDAVEEAGVLLDSDATGAGQLPISFMDAALGAAVGDHFVGTTGSPQVVYLSGSSVSDGGATPEGWPWDSTQSEHHSGGDRGALSSAGRGAPPSPDGGDAGAVEHETVAQAPCPALDLGGMSPVVGLRRLERCLDTQGVGACTESQSVGTFALPSAVGETMADDGVVWTQGSFCGFSAAPGAAGASPPPLCRPPSPQHGDLDFAAVLAKPDVLPPLLPAAETPQASQLSSQGSPTALAPAGAAGAMSAAPAGAALYNEPVPLLPAAETPGASQLSAQGSVFTCVDQGNDGATPMTAWESAAQTTWVSAQSHLPGSSMHSTGGVGAPVSGIYTEALAAAASGAGLTPCSKAVPRAATGDGVSTQHNLPLQHGAGLLHVLVEESDLVPAVAQKHLHGQLDTVLAGPLPAALALQPCMPVPSVLSPLRALPQLPLAASPAPSSPLSATPAPSSPLSAAPYSGMPDDSLQRSNVEVADWPTPVSGLTGHTLRLEEATTSPLLVAGMCNPAQAEVAEKAAGEALTEILSKGLFFAPDAAIRQREDMVWGEPAAQGSCSPALAQPAFPAGWASLAQPAEASGEEGDRDHSAAFQALSMSDDECDVQPGVEGSAGNAAQGDAWEQFQNGGVNCAQGLFAPDNIAVDEEDAGAADTFDRWPEAMAGGQESSGSAVADVPASTPHRGVVTGNCIKQGGVGDVPQHDDDEVDVQPTTEEQQPAAAEDSPQHVHAAMDHTPGGMAVGVSAPHLATPHTAVSGCGVWGDGRRRSFEQQGHQRGSRSPNKQVEPCSPQESCGENATPVPASLMLGDWAAEATPQCQAGMGFDAAAGRWREEHQMSHQGEEPAAGLQKQATVAVARAASEPVTLRACSALASGIDGHAAADEGSAVKVVVGGREQLGSDTAPDSNASDPVAAHRVLGVSAATPAWQQTPAPAEIGAWFPAPDSAGAQNYMLAAATPSADEPAQIITPAVPEEVAVTAATLHPVAEASGLGGRTGAGPEEHATPTASTSTSAIWQLLQSSVRPAPSPSTDLPPVGDGVPAAMQFAWHQQQQQLAAPMASAATPASVGGKGSPGWPSPACSYSASLPAGLELGLDSPAVAAGPGGEGLELSSKGLPVPGCTDGWQLDSDLGSPQAARAGFAGAASDAPGSAAASPGCSVAESFGGWAGSASPVDAGHMPQYVASPGIPLIPDMSQADLQLEVPACHFPGLLPSPSLAAQHTASAMAQAATPAHAGAVTPSIHPGVTPSALSLGGIPACKPTETPGLSHYSRYATPAASGLFPEASALADHNTPLSQSFFTAVPGSAGVSVDGPQAPCPALSMGSVCAAPRSPAAVNIAENPDAGLTSDAAVQEQHSGSSRSSTVAASIAAGYSPAGADAPSSPVAACHALTEEMTEPLSPKQACTSMAASDAADIATSQRGPAESAAGTPEGGHSFAFSFANLASSPLAATIER